MLVDIVSKNGNLLLNVVQRPDGSLDPEVEQVLAEMADWIAINGEAIYGTRPWLVYGEGAVRAKGGHFKEDFAYTAKDIRFTTKGDDTSMPSPWAGRPTASWSIRSLAKFPGVTGKIDGVALLGHRGKLQWTHDADGLAVELPGQEALRVRGRAQDHRRGPARVQARARRRRSPPSIQPDASGTITLSADDADLHGEQIKVEEKAGKPNIGFWDRADESASWKVNFKEPGKYRITACLAVVAGDASAVVEVGDHSVEIKPAATGSWDKFAESELGTVEVPQGGERVVKVRSRDAQSWKPINLRWIKLDRTGP